MSESTEFDAKTAFPARYYASFEASSDATATTSVTGFYDAWIMTDARLIPPADKMVALTEDQWNSRTPTGLGIQAGKLVSFIPTAPVLSLTVQAQSAYNAAFAYVQKYHLVLGEAAPTDWQSYMKALRAIISGTDTQSSVLPIAPSSLSS